MTLERWIRAVNREGNQALIPNPRPGRPARLTPAVQRQIEQDLDKSPQAFGLPRAAWDGPTPVIHLKEHFGVELKVRQAQKWMHRLGYSLKRASYTYVQARAEDARNFREELKKLHSLKPEETIVFQDETGFSLHPRLGRGWAKKGQRIRVPTTSQHRERLNLSGWVAPLLGKKGLIQTDRGNREGFLKVWGHMLQRLSGYDIWLYVDRATWHRGEEVELFVQSHHELHLEYLPPYQPALNPQERIWRQARYEATRNVCFPDLGAIYSRVIERVHHWSKKKVQQLCIIA